MVYLTAGFDSLIDLLKTYKKEKFVIYGNNVEKKEGNLYFKKSGREKFIEDLANCKAVFATAGFTLMTEAFYLKKPYCAFPLKGQFEQIYNAYLLEKIGYGRTVKNAEKDIISSFLYHYEEFKQNLSDYKYAKNPLFQKLDELFADNNRLLNEFHKKRQTIFTQFLE